MKFWNECGDNCTSCHHVLLDRQGTGVHPNGRCDSRPPWWELPEWQEWLRAAVSDRDPRSAVVTPERRESG